MNRRRSIKVTHHFNAPAEIVFDAWLDPVAISHWMFDPGYKQQKVIDIEIDPVVGGTFRFSLHREGKPIIYEGEFLELERPEFLSLTWRIAGVSEYTLVNVAIEPRDNGSLLTLIHNLGAVPDRIAEDVRQDWSADFASLSKKLN